MPSLNLASIAYEMACHSFYDHRGDTLVALGHIARARRLATALARRMGRTRYGSKRRNTAATARAILARAKSDSRTVNILF